jgi:uncharacterized membrane protein
MRNGSDSGNKFTPASFIKNLLKGRFFDHPLHVILIHFPIALLPLCAALDFYAYLNDDNYFAGLGFYSGLLGTASGLIAAIFGAMDLIRIKDDAKVFSKALLHGGLNILILSVFGIIIGVRFNNYPAIEPVNIFILVFEIVSVGALLYSGYLGGDLVISHGIGTKLKNTRLQ